MASYLRHVPSGDIYPYNRDMARHEDMEEYTPSLTEMKELAPEPADTPAKPAKKAAPKAPKAAKKPVEVEVEEVVVATETPDKEKTVSADNMADDSLPDLSALDDLTDD